jgi:predicted DNA-binding protein YlxM (UPF0122 family)
MTDFKNMNITQIQISHFWSKCEKVGECLIWQGAKDGRKNKERQYGRFWLNGKYVQTHRFAYYVSYGDLDPNLCVCHKCDNQLCLEPKHLFQGSYEDNNKDRNNKNRQAKGTDCVQTKLTEKQVYQILTDIYNNKYANILQIQNEYNVNRSVIYDILSGRSWKHVTHKLQVPLLELKNKIIKNNCETFIDKFWNI